MQTRLISDYVYFTGSRSLVIELDSHEDKRTYVFVFCAGGNYYRVGTT